MNLFKITGGSQFDDHVFARAGLCPRCDCGAYFWRRDGDRCLFVAFKLPNLLRRIFAEGAFSQAFVPILAEYKSKQGEDATRVFVSYVSGLLTPALGYRYRYRDAGGAVGNHHYCARLCRYRR